MAPTQEENFSVKKQSYTRQIPYINADGITLYKRIISFGNVNWESSHWMNLFSLELQPENFTKEIGTALGNKSKQHQYIDLSSRKNNGDKDPLPTRIKFLHYNDVYCCPELIYWLLSRSCASSKRKKKKGSWTQPPLAPLMHGKFQQNG